MVHGAALPRGSQALDDLCGMQRMLLQHVDPPSQEGLSDLRPGAPVDGRADHDARHIDVVADIGDRCQHRDVVLLGQGASRAAPPAQDAGQCQVRVGADRIEIDPPE